MKTATIQESNSDNKVNEYINLARQLAVQAKELAGQSAFLGRMLNDVVSHFRACEQADCEFTAYRECLATEEWFNKIEGLKTGRLKISDLI
jgi:hypothetical protein